MDRINELLQQQKAISQQRTQAGYSRELPHPGHDKLFQEILEDLSAIDEESREEQYELCSEEAKINAQRILEEIYKEFPRRYQIYPTDDREIAILAGGGQGTGKSILTLCDSEGRVSCFVALQGKTRYASYESPDELLGSGFLQTALGEMGSHSPDDQVLTTQP